MLGGYFLRGPVKLNIYEHPGDLENSSPRSTYHSIPFARLAEYSNLLYQERNNAIRGSEAAADDVVASN